MNEPSRIPAWRERYRVRLGAALGILFIWRVQPRHLILLAAGIAVGFLGILLRQWAAGCLKKNDELATSGPYALVRNPLYLGSFLAAIGLAAAGSSFSLSLRLPYLDRTLFFWCAILLMLESVYLPKIRKEEEDLRAKFGKSFEAYSRSVPALIPGRLAAPRFDFSTFSLEQWKKNREVWSLAGYLLVCLVLVSRYHFR